MIKRIKIDERKISKYSIIFTKIFLSRFFAFIIFTLILRCNIHLP